MVSPNLTAPPPLDPRTQVIRAATRLLAAQGYEGTSLQQVAAAVGVSKSAVLHHFPSKEALRQGVLEALLAHWRETLPGLMLAATSGRDRFEGIVGGLYDFFAEDPDRARVVLREALDRPGAIAGMLREQVRPWLNAIADAIREGQAAGRSWADADPEAYAFLVLQSVLLATASGPLATAAFGDDAPARQRRELTRMARIAIFTPRPTPTGETAP